MEVIKEFSKENILIIVATKTVAEYIESIYNDW